MGDIGALLMGLGAVLAALTPLGLLIWRRLGHINEAVNNKGRDEPTLRALVVETHAGVGVAHRLIETLDRKLEDHTTQDTTHFAELRKMMENK